MENIDNLSLAQRRLISNRIIKDSSYVSNKSASEKEKEKKEFEESLHKAVYSYYNFKLTHNGIVSYKSFEGCSRKYSINSYNNLLNVNQFDTRECQSSIPFDSSLGPLTSKTEIYRELSEKQAKKVKAACNKLCYYSGKREFMSKKSGKFTFKTALLTLTAPDNTEIHQFLKAFEGFLDYLRRTANCVYVWKKEVGKLGNNLHVHMLLNNFIPYYIVSWKWKRLLIAQGVKWPINEKGEPTTSHYRIELPKNVKQVGAYIAKYMSKYEGYSENIGYLWGKSKILDECKEVVLIECSDINEDLYNIYKKYKTVGNEYVKIVLVDLMKVKDLANNIYKIFEKQFYEFRDKITLTQRFQYV
jgi:hypothetical protein